MPQLSTLRAPVWAGIRSTIQTASRTSNPGKNVIQVRRMAGGGNQMHVTPSRFEWDKAKDDIHYFVCITGIPLAIFIAYMQIRIGPAKLVEIPEGYVPEEYEYLKDPIQRFLQRYNGMYHEYTKCYERHLYFLNQEVKKQKGKQLLAKVRELNTKRGDIRGWYFVPADIQKQEETIEGWKSSNL